MTNPLPPRLGVRPFPGEPKVERWQRQSWGSLAARLLGHGHGPRPVIVGVDGRAHGGGALVAERLSREVPGSAVVHTDELAHGGTDLGWDGLLAAGVLMPLRIGGAVSYRPPTWERADLAGSIDVPAGTVLLVIEGVGSTRVSLGSLLDVTVWVQSDAEVTLSFGLARDERDERVEQAFLDADRPWDRADFTVCGTPELVSAETIEDTVPRLLGEPPVGSSDVVLVAAPRSPWDGIDACRC